MSKFFGHLKTILVHKWWVFYYCCKFGIPWRGIVHDLSKFSPTEFFESVKYYTGRVSPIDLCKAQNGVSKAWMHHKGRNKHHYEYWQDNFDNGGVPVLMPFKESVEMVCDYLGAGRAYMKKSFSYKAEWEWWCCKKSKPLAMHPVNKQFIDSVLSRLYFHNKEMSRDTLKMIYESLVNPPGTSSMYCECNCSGEIRGFGSPNRFGRIYSESIADEIVERYGGEGGQVPVKYFSKTNVPEDSDGEVVGRAYNFSRTEQGIRFDMTLTHHLASFGEPKISLGGRGKLENGDSGKVINYDLDFLSLSMFSSMDSIIELRKD